MERIAYLRVAVHNQCTTPPCAGYVSPRLRSWSLASSICILPERGRQKSQPAGVRSSEVFESLVFFCKLLYFSLGTIPRRVHILRN